MPDAGTSRPLLDDATDTTADAPEVRRGHRADREFGAKERTQWQIAFQRFRRHRVAMISVVVFVLLLLFAFVGPLLWKYGTDELTIDLSTPPDGAHPFGTDNLGIDQLAVVMRGTGQSIKIALMIGLLGTAVGAIWGVVSGYYGGLTDSALMRFADLLLTIPGLALAAALGHNFGGSWWIIGLVLAGTATPYVARVTRGTVLTLREREFIEAARALGASSSRIMLRHLLPNAFPVLLVNATLLIATGILAETALSFVGFGIRPPDTSLGLLVYGGVGAIDTRPWLFYIPGVFIILIVLSVNFIGDGLRDALDPRQTRERR
ncbi:peptide/nickel transport system permease protein [Jatrophihabitans endophyticus]|uniref:Peptide/nickel transport system permease protein n=1 Tax=Jatrophihabitans endophyticus TaxID=1206085 RepID=A0A1M5T920_9ACTN|nr:ABC transporter permease [Jatrophihabitans endophyticus]SHH47212.1 peptide/nickel transport system permease protein [Jatrophihabitans endophyticus]